MPRRWGNLVFACAAAFFGVVFFVEPFGQSLDYRSLRFLAVLGLAGAGAYRFHRGGWDDADEGTIVGDRGDDDGGGEADDA